VDGAAGTQTFVSNESNILCVGKAHKMKRFVFGILHVVQRALLFMSHARLFTEQVDPN